MSDSQKIRLGDAIFNNIDDNDFLNVLYDNMLYNYAILKLHLEGLREPRNVDVNAALRFADLLSKSTHETKADEHKMWAQEIVTILMELYPDNEDVSRFGLHFLIGKHKQFFIEQDTVDTLILVVLVLTV